MTIPYLLYSSIIISIFYCIYHILLRKETFFELNRYILLFGILCCIVIPAIPTPIKITVAETIIESQPIQLNDLTILTDANTVISNSNNSTEISPVNNQITLQTANSRSKIKVLPLIYLIGVSILLFNLFIQLFKIIYTIARYNKENRIVQLPFQKSPSSFFNYVFIGTNSYSKTTLSQIINHEKIHSKQKHTIDIILAEIVIIFQWFNPFAWMYRQAIEKNLEFIVDNEMLDVVESKKEYQYNLLNLAVKNFPLSVVTNYNQSLIKTRIKMMNTKKSSLKQSWKYLLFGPILCLTIFLFNPSNVGSIPFNNEVNGPVMIIVNADATKSDLDRVREDAETLGYRLSFSNVKWDANNQLKNYKSSLQSSCGSFQNIVDYTDINRHNPVAMFQSDHGSSGLINEGPLSIEFVEKLIEILPSETKSDEIVKIKVISSFTDEILSYEDFIKSESFKNDKNRFVNERKWNKLFTEDLTNQTNSFNYFIDGEPISIKELKSKMKLRDIRDIVIKENNSDKADFTVFSVPYKGYQFLASSATGKSRFKQYSDFKEYANSLIEEYKIESPNSTIKYYYEGLEKEDLFNTIDSSSFSIFVVEKGNNFDQYGNHLGNEIRVRFKK